MDPTLVTWLLFLAWGLALMGAFMFDLVQTAKATAPLARRVRSWAVYSVVIAAGTIVGMLRSGSSLAAALMCGLVGVPLVVAFAMVSGWVRYEMPLGRNRAAKARQAQETYRPVDFSSH